jgi:CBS domain-containing protein
VGDKKVSTQHDEHELRLFTVAVLNDLKALEQMLDRGLLEEDVMRIGAEQEMFLVGSSMHPAGYAVEVIEDAKDPRLTTEIGKFNLEANLTPRRFVGDALRQMENELNEVVTVVNTSAEKLGASVVLAGILPTIQMSDLSHANLTPHPRYEEIDRVCTKLYGKDRLIQIKGIDELQLTLQDTHIEFSNTSFQVHLQIRPKDFARYYNWAQAIAAPVLASAVNSPFLLNHKLWHETRLALFEHATDTRSVVHRERSHPPRVNFGDRWVGNSILEILREDAIRFRVLLTQAVEENSLDVLAAGGVPRLAAWRLHNGTIWRWNRPCYGIADGVPGLRIEARFLPAGPSVVDEMANAAFFLGLMNELPAEFGDVTTYISFDEVKANFFNAGRYGLQAQLKGIDGKSRRVSRLILEELLPRARKGLERVGIDETDSTRLLDIIEARATLETSGARWMLNSYAAMDPRAKPNVRMRTLTAAMKANQKAGTPVHEWALAQIPLKSEWIDNYKTVEQFMAVDLFTVRAEDVIDLAASLMHWRHVRHVPVEDDSGNLIGIVSYRDLIELLAEGKINGQAEWAIRDVMKTDLITVTPETPALAALQLMRERNIGALPVVHGKKLIGIVTAYDFLTVSAKLFEERLSSVVGASD